MTDPDFSQQPDGATPIDDVSGLLSRSPGIYSVKDLNEAESLNIISAVEWVEQGRIRDVFSLQFYRELHRRMLNEVWAWAGEFRTSNTNIGVSHYQIQEQLTNAGRDYQTQWESGKVAFIEFIASYHHRLVWIHPFPNGNGRWARLACDAVGIRLHKDHQPIIWGNSDLVLASAERSEYIAALKAADNHDLGPLITYLQVRNPGR